jgi:hypothetical protein
MSNAPAHSSLMLLNLSTSLQRLRPLPLSCRQCPLSREPPLPRLLFTSFVVVMTRQIIYGITKSALEPPRVQLRTEARSTMEFEFLTLLAPGKHSSVLCIIISSRAGLLLILLLMTAGVHRRLLRMTGKLLNLPSVMSLTLRVRTLMTSLISQRSLVMKCVHSKWC